MSMSDRDDFEEWYQGVMECSAIATYPVRRQALKDDRTPRGYLDPKTDLAWSAWQARGTA
ncbi:hypothetical protein [Stutzerimonas nitrititolerans]|uniref:Uncharacterized protein n=1 Tax=Stutzerimonas nitrititolerans TaxID=2482751 RepID=A0AA41WIK3_9GAMM|nr:hypothetical protein [Stutzerimonas nitrititolerans]MCO7546141.1 hypothetical protein [Stutzerimonas nitrititolerans]